MSISPPSTNAAPDAEVLAKNMTSEEAFTRRATFVNRAISRNKPLEEGPELTEEDCKLVDDDLFTTPSSSVGNANTARNFSITPSRSHSS